MSKYGMTGGQAAGVILAMAAMVAILGGATWLIGQAAKSAKDGNIKKAGKVASYKTEISKQTIMNKISELNINVEETKTSTKRKVDNIYCIADEDHVHLQKGGIEEPRLIVVYDSIMKNGKRTKLRKNAR